jgi:hypothetical protein
MGNQRKERIMGMGAAPCHAWTITLDGLKAICPQEVEACENAFKDHGLDWNSFALKNEQGIWKEDPKDLLKQWEALQKAFEMATKVGESHLELGIGYYNDDDGDRYDDLEQGCYFTIENVTQLTPAGEKFKEYLEENSWTVFG